MATCSFVFGVAENGFPVAYAAGAVSEEETVSASNASTTSAATGSQNVCSVTTDTACWVSFGTAPNAGTDNPRWLVPAGATRDFRVQKNWKGACIAA